MKKSAILGFSEETSYDRVRNYDSLNASNGVVIYTHVQPTNPDKPNSDDSSAPNKDQLPNNSIRKNEFALSQDFRAIIVEYGL